MLLLLLNSPSLRSGFADGRLVLTLLGVQGATMSHTHVPLRGGVLVVALGVNGLRRKATHDGDGN